jgi:hypothetical protein
MEFGPEAKSKFEFATAAVACEAELSQLTRPSPDGNPGFLLENGFTGRGTR